MIDTGIDMSHELLQKTKDQVKKTSSWIGGEGDEDSSGIGTHAAALVLRIAPTSELYIARIAGDRSSRVKSDIIAKVCRV